MEMEGRERGRDGEKKGETEGRIESVRMRERETDGLIDNKEPNQDKAHYCSLRPKVVLREGEGVH